MWMSYVYGPLTLLFDAKFPSSFLSHPLPLAQTAKTQQQHPFPSSRYRFRRSKVPSVLCGRRQPNRAPLSEGPPKKGADCARGLTRRVARCQVGS